MKKPLQKKVSTIPSDFFETEKRKIWSTMEYSRQVLCSPISSLEEPINSRTPNPRITKKSKKSTRTGWDNL